MEIGDQKTKQIHSLGRLGRIPKEDDFLPEHSPDGTRYSIYTSNNQRVCFPVDRSTDPGLWVTTPFRDLFTKNSSIELPAKCCKLDNERGDRVKRRLK
jgi:hypothetical protein